MNLNLILLALVLTKDMWDGLISLAFLGVALVLVLISTLTMFVGLGRSIENFNLFQRMAERLDEHLAEVNQDLKAQGFTIKFGENFFFLAIEKHF